MRRKGDGERDGAPEVSLRQIRRDLELRGLRPDFSGPVAERVVRIARDLTPDEYAAVLDGVAVAYGIHCESRHRVGGSDGPEIQRLVQDFAVELKKLEEGLRVLSTYLLRIRNRARPEATRLMH